MLPTLADGRARSLGEDKPGHDGGERWRAAGFVLIAEHAAVRPGRPTALSSLVDASGRVKGNVVLKGRACTAFVAPDSFLHGGRR